MKNYLKAGLILVIGGGTLLYAHSKIQDPTQKAIIEVPIALVTAGGMIAAARSRNQPYPPYREETPRYQTPQERDPRERISIDRSQLHIHLTQDNGGYHFHLPPVYQHHIQPRQLPPRIPLHRHNRRPNDPPAIDL